MPRQADRQCVQLFVGDCQSRFASDLGPGEAALVQSAGTQPDADPVVHEHLDPVRSPVGKEVRMMRPCFTKHLDHARQRSFCSGAHVQRLAGHPYCVDPDRFISSRSPAPHSVIAARGQLTFT